MPINTSLSSVARCAIFTQRHLVPLALRISFALLWPQVYSMNTLHGSAGTHSAEQTALATLGDAPPVAQGSNKSITYDYIHRSLLVRYIYSN